MPVRKRTDETKHTPSTSPSTSTPHASADQHHRLRHAGPSITTRSSVTAASSKPPPALPHPKQTPSIPPTHKNAREQKPITEVSPFGARSSFVRFLCFLLSVVLLLFGWYLYGMITLLERVREEVGWWDIIVGDTRGRMWWETSQSRWQGGRAGEKLESSLNALADALGISPMQVASAVKPLVPQASLTSMASRSEETGGSEAVRILFGDTIERIRRASSKEIESGTEEEEAAEYVSIV